MVGGEEDQRVVEAAEPLQLVEQAAEPVVDLPDQSHIGRPHRVRRIGTLKGDRFLMLAVGGEHGVLVDELRLVAIERQAVLGAVHVVIRRRRHVGPVRLDVAEMQEPRLLAHVLDEAHGLARHVGRLGMLLGDARRQVNVAHVPARELLAIGTVGGDHVVAPRIVGIVALRAQVGGIAALVAGRRMAVVAVELLEAAGAHQRGQRRAAFDAIALQAVGVGQHMRLAGQRHAHAGRLQVIADGPLAQAERHPVPGGAVTEHVAAGVVGHARGAADAGLHIGAREEHAALAPGCRWRASAGADGRRTTGDRRAADRT